jgi:hypothetical protein
MKLSQNDATFPELSSNELSTSFLTLFESPKGAIDIK